MSDHFVPHWKHHQLLSLSIQIDTNNRKAETRVETKASELAIEVRGRTNDDKIST